MANYCKKCYFHPVHSTPFQCELQQLVSKGNVRIFFQDNRIKTAFYKTTTYSKDDVPYTYSEAPYTNQEIQEVGHFRILTVDIDFGKRKVPEKLQVDGKASCQIVIGSDLCH
jgi:hypothetical protein